MTIAVFAGLCFVAPPAVMAFGHGGNVVNCLIHGDDVDHGMHGDAGHKDHGGAMLPGNHGMNCCGLFFLNALAPSSAPVLDGCPLTMVLWATPESSHPGRVPDRLDRPPIPLLSV
jgi:hypothetical protein